MLLLSVGVLFSSCKDDEGCTDPFAENFDPDAIVDDGTCLTQIEKFLGTYTVDEECSSDSYSYTMSITNSNSNDASIIIANFGDFQKTVRARVVDNFITIPDQTLTNDTGTISITSGLGEIVGNVLTVTYTYNIDGGATEVCSKTCMKI